MFTIGMDEKCAKIKQTYQYIIKAYNFNNLSYYYLTTQPLLSFLFLSYFINENEDY